MNWTTYLPHIHELMWGFLALVFALLLIVHFKSIATAAREMFSEKNQDGTTGKLSSKRFGVMLFALAIVYVFIYSMHTNKPIDHVAFAMLIAAVILGWHITTPEALSNLMDKVKGFMKPDVVPEKQEQQQ